MDAPPSIVACVDGTIDEGPLRENGIDDPMQGTIEVIRDAGPREVDHNGQIASIPEGSRQLNVTDALSYLDAVKTQFVERPDVYNNFLDIMKDFKSQVIDTPGVIERVSTLFRGHNDLIQGFNTFLPPGYRIECTSDALETTTTITVTTPAGTTTQSTDNQQLLHAHIIPQLSSAATPPLPQTTVHVPMMTPAESPVIPTTSPVPYGTSSAISTLNGMAGSYAAQVGRPSAYSEFHHAIQYVNKIKTRFEDDPETYKLFLEILHSYRKEQNHDDVYYKVEYLFRDAPDLLAEFKKFLPMDGSGQAFRQDSFHERVWSELPDKKGSTAPKRKKKPVEREIQPAPQVPISSKSAVGRAKKSKHIHAKDGNVPPSPSYRSRSRPASPSHPGHSHHAAPSGSAATQSGNVGPSGSGSGSSQDELAFFDRAKKALESREMYDEFLKLLNLFSREIVDARTLIARAEAFLGGGELYAQFKDLMGWDTRREENAEGPPGSIRNWTGQATETEERFGKSYRRLPLPETKLACSGRDELCRSVLNDHWVSHPTWASEESGFVAHKKNSYEEALHKSEEERHEFQFYIDIITRTIALLLPICDRIMEMSADERNAFRLPPDFGGSSKSIYYRAIKKVYGRDAQGLEVLQALQDCPAVAVPVVLPRLKQKNEEWRRAQRDWNKVWREVDARNFYKSLDHQGATFKSNDKKYITNKSLVTEIESAKGEVAERAAQAKAKAKVYKRSAPIESVNSYDNIKYAPHLEFEFNDIPVLQDALKLVFSFLDRSSIQYSSHERRSVERMLRSFIPLFCMLPMAEFDAAFGPPLESDNTDNEDVGHEDTAGSDEGEESHQGSGSGSKSHIKSGGTSGRRSAGGGSSHGHGNGGVPANDLRKKLLKTVQEKAVKARSGSASASRAVSPSVSDDDHAKPVDAPVASGTPKRKKGGRTKEANEICLTENEEWVKLMPVAFDIGKEGGEGKPDSMDVDGMEDPLERLAKHGVVDQKPFFTNTTFYTLLRLLQLLYSRLLYCKETAQKSLAQDVKKSLFKVNPVAEELGLVDAHGPGAVLAIASNVPPHSHPLIDHTAPQNRPGPAGGMIGDTAYAASQNPVRPEAHFYSYLLDALEKLFENDLDQATFEENMRFLFGTKVQTAVTDGKCQELLTLLARSRAKVRGSAGAGGMSVKEMIVYRREAEQYLGQDDHLYRIEWEQDRRKGTTSSRPNSNVMRMWLLGARDASVDLRGSVSSIGEEVRKAARWRVYAESYVMSYPTELVDSTRVRKPFLQRTRLDDESAEEGKARLRGRRFGFVKEGEVAVCVEPARLKLVYVHEDGKGDCGWAIPAPAAATDGAMAKHFPSALPSYHHESAQRVPDASSSRHPPSARAFPRDKTFTKTARRNRETDAELLTVVAALATFVGHIPSASASANEVGLGEPRPDVPEFLCPALLTASESEPVPPSASATTSSSSSYPSQTSNPIDCVTHHQQGDVAAFVAPPSDSDENSYQIETVVRSTFSTASSSSFSLLADYSFIPTHDDRPPSESDQRQRQLALKDVETDSYSNVDNNANANANTAFANDNFNTTTSSFRSTATATTDGSNNNKKSQSRQLKRKKRRRVSPNNKRSSDDNDSVASSSYSSTSSTQCPELYTSRTIPDRYELGNDGRWHKLSVSSPCSQCECQTSIDVDDSADNDISSTGVVNNDASYEAEDNSSVSASSTPSLESDAVTLIVPDGWDRDFNSVVYQVPLIVIASLLLAAAVTGAVWFTFFWRRRRRTARKLALQRDLEKRKRVEEGNDSVYGDDGGEGDEDAVGRGGGAAASAGRGKRREKTSEEKAKARWARATEQWKAHVRWIHRRRRGRASIVDGMKQRNAAMASGISLVRSIASAASSRSQLPPPPSRENNNAAAASISNSSTSGVGARSRSRSGSRSRSRVGSRRASSEAQPAERAVVQAGESRLGLDSDGEDEVVAQAGASIAPVSFRARGTRDRGNGNSVPGEGGASRGGAGALSDGHRSIFVVPQDQNQNLNQNRTRRQSRRRRRREQSSEVGEADERYREAGEDEWNGEVEDPTQSTWSSAPRSTRRSRLRPDVDAIAANSNGLSGDRAPNASSAIVSSAPVVISAIHDPWAPRGEYDRPPPELCPVDRAMAEDDEEVMRQGPPAYRSRRSVDGADIGAVRRGMRRRRGRRRVRDEKIATAAATAASTSASGSGYVPSPGDYAPYSSSGETDDGIEEAASGSSRSSSMERSGGVNQQTSMHVAVDDKQALARLAMYASAPPPLPSSPPPPHSPLDPTSFTSSSHPSSSSLHSSQHVPVEPNAPPEPEWERFEDCEYPYDYEHVDSPGAGPGPSTISARSRSASPSSLSASRRSISRSQQRTQIHSPSYSETQSQQQTRSAFPAPPQPIFSKLAYAPADAGLVHPPMLADADEYNYSSYSYAYGYGSNDGYGEHDFGLDLDSALERMVQGPSAPPPPPPFSATGAPPPLEYEDVPGPGGVGGVPSAPPEDVLLAGASAPPLFEEHEDGDEDEVVGYAASAPPLDVVENGDDTSVIHSGNLQDDLPPESPLPPSSSDSDRTVESADQNGMPCPPRRGSIDRSCLMMV
ncbi:hypothetical protein A7U60_g5803 [Sanghuangporus baumii]|uniref:Histone deacetylase interacting domain-containing protein n=1 Tax=Sanghuangporus baumii TaxID=108892 RepID=A0A9Q5HW23_SANBA|nr:hypothetical protein A7U60_g5803 [Sanghuangporus baumii]